MLTLSSKCPVYTVLLLSIKSSSKASLVTISPIKEFNPTFVMIAARGTSDNAARYAQYLFSMFFLYV